LIIVCYGYKIAEKLSNKNTAKIAGLLLAVLWFMPWFSVRNLVEFVPVPLLILSTWAILRKNNDQLTWRSFLIAGIIAGIGFSIRYQTIIYAGGMGLALLLQKRYWQGIVFGAGYFLMVILIQGGIDFYIWGRPFAELTEYFLYNAENAENYITGEWYNYLVLLLGVFIPPVSIFILAGTFKNWKKHLIIFLPVLLFFLFHSFFPNKQERFIFTIVPFIIIIGVIGWQQILETNSFIARQKSFIKYSWIFFWSLNFVALMAVSTMYSKKARAEAMTYLSRYSNVKSVLLENTNSGSSDIIPKFYLGEWVNVYDVNLNFPAESLPREAYKTELEPRFFLFYRDQNLDERVNDMKKYFPEMVFETAAEPGMVDMIMHWLNPHNKNETIYIYRNRKYFPDKIDG
jgi:4-amino-4-deoxy-L-arabinose transferase-like glycosyltransferase